MWSQFFDAPLNWQNFLLSASAVVIIAFAAARAVQGGMARLLARLLQSQGAETSPAVQTPLRVIGVGTFLLVLGLAIGPAFELAGLQPRKGLDLSALNAWVFGTGLRIVLIIVVAFALSRVTMLMVQRFEREIAQGSRVDALERVKRVRTLGTVVSKVVHGLIIGVALLMVLDLLSIDITPVLTGAGIVGLAVGFGAQTLVRDVISGFLLLLENQVRVGDIAAINGISGSVEEINLRTIALRDGEGVVYVFPNGSITSLANKTKDYSYYQIDLPISYSEDPERVFAVLREIGAGLQADPAYGPSILAALDINGVDSFAEAGVIVKMRIKTIPTKQWEVGRELRRRIKKTFDERKIAIPYAQRVVTIREERAVDEPSGRDDATRQ